MNETLDHGQNIVITFLLQLPAVIAALTAAFIALAALLRTKENGVVAAQTGRKADDIIQKSVQIHELANSNLSEMTKKLEIALERIDGLQNMVQEQKEVARLAREAKQSPHLQSDKPVDVNVVNPVTDPVHAVLPESIKAVIDTP